jgi:hypothetical protein
MAIFNEKMGASNYVILNTLRRKEELRTATAQEGGAAEAPAFPRRMTSLRTPTMVRTGRNNA